MKVVVKIREVLEKTITIDAATEVEAVNRVHHDYCNGDIVLGADDFQEVTIAQADLPGRW